jgi:hypothetical protein
VNISLNFFLCGEVRSVKFVYVCVFVFAHRQDCFWNGVCISRIIRRSTVCVYVCIHILICTEKFGFWNYVSHV